MTSLHARNEPALNIVDRLHKTGMTTWYIHDHVTESVQTLCAVWQTVLRMATLPWLAVRVAGWPAVLQPPHHLHFLAHQSCNSASFSMLSLWLQRYDLWKGRAVEKPVRLDPVPMGLETVRCCCCQRC